jgi:hypothetical protein
MLEIATQGTRQSTAGISRGQFHCTTRLDVGKPREWEANPTYLFAPVINTKSVSCSGTESQGEDDIS